MSDLNKTMDAVNELNKTHGVKQRGGKMYTQVVHRMEALRRHHGTDFGVDTKILVDDGHRVVIKAIITNSDGHTVGSGMAEEIRGQGHVNTTSALENAETSAIGRALASIGLAGGEYASANEMDAVPRKKEAIEAKPKPEPTPEPVPDGADGLQKYRDLLREIDVKATNMRTYKELQEYMKSGWLQEQMGEMSNAAPELHQRCKEILIRRNAALKPRSN
tara:strand:+ start:212 stop:868 length:657 start_codon:yes stop_codon:yes gene_type:complete